MLAQRANGWLAYVGWSHRESVWFQSTVLVHTEEFLPYSAAFSNERMNGLPKRGYSGRVEECKKTVVGAYAACSGPAMWLEGNKERTYVE